MLYFSNLYTLVISQVRPNLDYYSNIWETKNYVPTSGCCLEKISNIFRWYALTWNTFLQNLLFLVTFMFITRTEKLNQLSLLTLTNIKHEVTYFPRVHSSDSNRLDLFPQSTSSPISLHFHFVWRSDQWHYYYYGSCWACFHWSFSTAYRLGLWLCQLWWSCEFFSAFRWSQLCCTKGSKTKP